MPSGWHPVLSTLDLTPETRPDVDGRRQNRTRPEPHQGGGWVALLREKGSFASRPRYDRSSPTSPSGSRRSDALRCRSELVRSGLGGKRAAPFEAACAAAGFPGPSLPAGRARIGHRFSPDGGHWILDAPCERIPDPRRARRMRLARHCGVVEHGYLSDWRSTAGASDRRAYVSSNRPEFWTEQELVANDRHCAPPGVSRSGCSCPRWFCLVPAAWCQPPGAVGRVRSWGCRRRPATAASGPSAMRSCSPGDQITAKGANKMYEPVIVEVVDRAKGSWRRPTRCSQGLERSRGQVENGARSPRRGDLERRSRKCSGAVHRGGAQDALAFYKSRSARR